MGLGRPGGGEDAPPSAGGPPCRAPAVPPAALRYDFTIAGGASAVACVPGCDGPVPIACQQQDDEIRPPIALRCLGRDEVLEKLNAVPAFAVVNGKEQLVAEQDEEGNPSICRFYLEIADAQQAADARLAAAAQNDQAGRVWGASIIQAWYRRLVTLPSEAIEIASVSEV